MSYSNTTQNPQPTGGSDESDLSSRISNVSISSAQSAVQIIKESPFIERLMNMISRDIDELDNTATDLRNWRKQLDPNTYKPVVWTHEMTCAYQQYKDLVGKIGRSHQEFLRCERRTKEEKNATPGQHILCAKLALQWGCDALTAADARLEFLKIYRNAYKLDSIDNHIETAQDVITSGKKALYNAKKCYDSAYNHFS
ncbi:hypothetical protein F5B22DRAFT_646699 [Xylaria bambusicola]|uniref:uncharacterized protein n=1 Tax=Xylaria bambusicola TaxID=326684 RepID=UPI00200727B9|nr:uncharacterized protein F5B22DRAFT_646699 [Xylaria bambusicola]KAI0515425.1 hypothetical protein F5B22DRAFT_646699 [Xylaria bambusicola]